MLNRQTRPVRTLFTATALMTCAQAAITLQAAGQAVSTATTASTSASVAIAAAKDLVAAGKLIQARNVLIPLSAAPAALTDAERSQLTSQLASLDRAIRAADQNEISLQKADLALEQGDLRSANRHVTSVINKGSAEQKAQAHRLQSKLTAAQAQFGQSVDTLLTQASDQFKAGRASQSKATLEAIFRSGVALTPAQTRIVDDVQTRIIELEQSKGVILADASAGMMQPGVVNRDPQPAPAAQPTTPPPAPAPTPAPAAQPEATPAAPAAQPTSDAMGTDVVAAARKAEAMNLLAEADKAYNERRFNEAQTKYGKLLSIHRDQLGADQVGTINNRLAEIKLQMGAGGADALGQLAADRGLAKQQKLAEFQNELGLAKQALDAGDADRAQDYLARAQLTLSSGRNLFAESEYQGYVSQVNDRKSELESRRVELAKKQADEQDRQRAADAARANAARASEKEAKIRENIDRVRALQIERRYGEALQVVDQILFLDPQNATGLLLKDVLTDSKVYADFDALDQEQWKRAADLSIQNKEALIPPSDIMNFPSDWPAISSRRGEPITMAEPPETRQALALIKSKRIPVNFNENSLSDVIGFVQAVTQLNVDVDWQSLEAVSITRETPVTLNLTQVPVETVLNRVLEKISQDDQNAAGWAIEDGVLRIASKEAINRNKLLVIYDVRDLLVEITDFTNAPNFDLSQTTQDGGGGSQSPFQGRNQNNNNGGGRTLQERTDDLIKIITETIDSSGWREVGGTTGFIQQLRGNLIITQTPKNHRAIAGLLSKLREVRSLQVNCETRFLLVNQSFFERIGFDLDIYFNMGQVKDFNRQPLFAADPTLRGQDFFNANGGVNRNVQGSLLPIVDTNGVITGWAPVRQGYWNTGQWSPIGAQQGSNGIVSNLMDSSFAGKVGSTPSLGIAGSFMDDVQVDFLLQATQADKRSVSLTAPRLTFTNGQRSYLAVTNDRRYIADLEVQTSESSAAFDPTPGTLSTGAVLDVTGTISSDRRYVTLEVRTSISQLVQIRQVATTAVVGGQLVSSASQGSAFAEYPEVNRTTVNTTVTVPDQGTVLLGGQRVVSEIEVEAGVPVLSKIPIISRFFTNTAKSKEEQTLLILIKPTILIQNEEEEKNFPGLLDALKTGANGN